MNAGIERLAQGEKIAAGSAVALFACMFLSWFNFSYAAGDAWESLHYISPILAISIVATLGVTIARMTRFDIGDIPGGLVIFVLGSLSALLILIRLIDPISTVGIEGGSTSAGVEAGAFLGFIAALGIAAGGYIATDGKAIDRLKALLPNSSAAAPQSFPEGPPPMPQTHSSDLSASTPAPGPTPSPGPPPAPELTPEPTRTVTPVVTAEPTPPPVPEAAPLPTAESTESAAPPVEVESTTPSPAVDPGPTAPTRVMESPSPGPPAPEEPRSVFCEGCGAPLRPQDRFCRKCGHQQAQTAT